MADALRLTILTPTRALLEDAEVAWIKAQLAGGTPIGIWPGHAPLLAETARAPLRYADSGGEQQVDLQAGVLQVEQTGHVRVLTGGRIADEGQNGDGRV